MLHTTSTGYTQIIKSMKVTNLIGLIFFLIFIGYETYTLKSPLPLIALILIFAFTSGSSESKDTDEINEEENEL